MSTDRQGTKWRRKIAENFNRLSRVHERYRRQTDGTTIAYERTSYCHWRSNWMQP